MIVGVSFDDPAENQDWAEDEGSEYELWTDDDKTLALTYGSIATDRESSAGRITRLLDDTGKVIVEYDVVSVSTNPQEVLEDCEVIFGS
jgi:peroxiredoxin